MSGRSAGGAAGLFAQAFITGFSGAIMPGPVLVATLALVVTCGFWAGPAIVLGHAVIEFALVLALVAGLHRLLSRPDAPLARAIGAIGGVMLLLMAADMLRGLPALSLHTVRAEGGRHHPVLAGIVLSAANPYFWVWWATIGLGLLTQALSQRGTVGLAAFYSGHILSDLVWYSLVAALLAGGGRLLSDGVYRALIGGCAACLLAFGLRFVRYSLWPPAAQTA